MIGAPTMSSRGYCRRVTASSSPRNAVLSGDALATLKALPAAQLAELRDREYLEWMYFQMASIAHVSALVARKNRRLSGVTAARA